MWSNKRSLTAVAAAMVLLAGALTPLALAQGVQTFILSNATGIDIYYVHISPHDVNDWQEDVLGEDVLEDGASLKINFHRSETARYWDLRVMDQDHNAVVWPSLDLYRVYSVTLYYDADTGRAWAETESI